MYEPLSRIHPTVTLSERIAAKTRPDQGRPSRYQSGEYNVSRGQSNVREAHAEAMAIRDKFKTGGASYAIYCADCRPETD